MNNSVFLLWLEGVNPQILSTVPSLQKHGGVDLKLTTRPIVEPSVCYYQTITGMGAGKFGHFDAVSPENYLPVEETGVPDGVQGKLLPDLLRARKIKGTYLETSTISELDALAGQNLTCTIVRFQALQHAPAARIDEIVSHCLGLLAAETHLIVLTDVWTAPAHTFVNINNFLADVGLLEAGQPPSRANINWAETLAYSLGTGQVWINLRGRERGGIVGAGKEYQEVAEALVNELSTNWLDPRTNASVVKQVLKKDALYSGDYLFKAPEFVVDFQPGYAASAQARAMDFDAESIIETNPLDAASSATPYARLIGSGPCFSQGIEATGELTDIVPTLLYLLGQNIPMHIDGHVLTSVFTSAYQQQVPVKQSEDDEDFLSDEEEGMIVDRLRDLGYLG